ncbi:MAG: hypothetical protein KDJ74_10415 [Notoacmeibacter sp.]|nr:hypothetical protein [Notoacmeibacter sp.]
MRFELETYESLEGDAKVLADRVMEVSADGIGGPFNMLLKSPVTGALIVDLLDHFNGGRSSLDRRTMRLSVLVLARHAKARYAWWTHTKRALRAGEFSQAQIDAINRGQRPEDLGTTLDRVYDYVRALSAGAPTPAPVLSALRDVIPESQVVDLILYCGTYTTIAMVLNEANVALPAGEVDTLMDG